MEDSPDFSTTDTEIDEINEIKIENIIIDYDINNVKGVDPVIYQSLKHSIKDLLINQNLDDLHTWIILVKSTIKLVENYNFLSGPEKKIAVVNVIESIMNEQVISEETTKRLKFFTDYVMPGLIEAIVLTWHQIPPNWTFCRCLTKLKKLICCCK